MLLKKGKATIMNELFNISCFKEISLYSVPLLDDRASLSKRKEKHNLNTVLVEKGKKYYE